MSCIKILTFVAVSMIIFSLYGCSTSQTPEVMPKEVQLTQNGGACGSGVGLNVGDTLVLILDVDALSDYTWELGFHVPAVIEPASEQKDQSESNPASENGSATFRFLAVGEGVAELHMIYGPPDKNSPEFETCQLDINVK